MIAFRIIDSSEVGRAYAWHAEFAKANDSIFPRTEAQFDQLALARCLWCAIDEDKDQIVGMSYVFVDEGKGEIEVGGLMVSETARGKGIGEIMMRLPLAHFLVNEQPLFWETSPKILTHTLEDNEMPKKIIERCGFKKAFTVTIPGSKLPGLRTGQDGNVHGIEFHLEVPTALCDLSLWLERWTGMLRDNTIAEIKMLNGESLKGWAQAIKEMAECCSGTKQRHSNKDSLAVI